MVSAPEIFTQTEHHLGQHESLHVSVWVPTVFHSYTAQLLNILRRYMYGRLCVRVAGIDMYGRLCVRVAGIDMYGRHVAGLICMVRCVCMLLD